MIWSSSMLAYSQCIISDAILKHNCQLISPFLYFYYQIIIYRVCSHSFKFVYFSNNQFNKNHFNFENFMFYLIHIFHIPFYISRWNSSFFFFQYCWNQISLLPLFSYARLSTSAYGSFTFFPTGVPSNFGVFLFGIQTDLTFQLCLCGLLGNNTEVDCHDFLLDIILKLLLLGGLDFPIPAELHLPSCSGLLSFPPPLI